MAYDLYTKLSANYYTTKLDYPGRPPVPAILNTTASKLTRDQLLTVPTVSDQYNAELDAWKAARTAYNADQTRLNDQFKTDLEVYHDVEGNPKADLLFSKAWALGHSAGFSDVASYYDDLADLIK